jgi:hypothetical protein
VTFLLTVLLLVVALLTKSHVEALDVETLATYGRAVLIAIACRMVPFGDGFFSRLVAGVFGRRWRCCWSPWGVGIRAREQGGGRRLLGRASGDEAVGALADQLALVAPGYSVANVRYTSLRVLGKSGDWWPLVATAGAAIALLEPC